MAEVVWEGKTDGDGPLVTYRVQCYQHAAFVREAVGSVLAQTYRPLEVLITDDASPDQTFPIVTELARAYRGPHRVVLHRSERNRDILAHANEALPLMRGAFFIWLSGDDIAEREQTERLVASWRETGASAVWSNSRIIDEHGGDLGPLLSADHPYTLDLPDYADGRFLDFPYHGACGYPREVIDRFGPVPAHLGARGLEHHFGFRAALLGRKCYLPELLMRRRWHPGRKTAGENAGDRGIDPMLVHERQIRVRLQVLTGCLDTIRKADGILHSSPAGLPGALSQQIVNETRRLLEFEAFRANAAGSKGSAREHSGWRYKPNAVTRVRDLPERAATIVAAECRYFAIPWSLGPTEPCGLRNHVYPEVVSAWTEEELMAKLNEERVPEKF